MASDVLVRRQVRPACMASIGKEPYTSVDHASNDVCRPKENTGTCQFHIGTEAGDPGLWVNGIIAAGLKHAQLSGGICTTAHAQPA